MTAKIFKRNLSTYLLITLLWSSCFAALGYAGDTVTWAYFSYPPLYILENDNEPTGFGFDITNLAISAMPEYKHVVRKIPIKRFIEQMLITRRGDYFLSLSSTIYDAEKLGYADKITLIPIEDETYLTGSVACSKNERGRKVIEKVNSTLRKEIVSGKIYQILSRWVPDKIRREFKRQYEALLVNPLKQ